MAEVGTIIEGKYEILKLIGKTHIIINKFHIAILDNFDAVVILPLENNEYEMFRIPRAALLYQLSELYPDIKKPSKKISVNIKKMDIDTLLKEIEQYDRNLMIGEFFGGNVQNEWAYFWKGEQIYQYSFTEQIKRESNTAEIRKELLRLLQVKEEVNAYHGQRN